MPGPCARRATVLFGSGRHLSAANGHAVLLLATAEAGQLTRSPSRAAGGTPWCMSSSQRQWASTAWGAPRQPLQATQSRRPSSQGGWMQTGMPICAVSLAAALGCNLHALLERSALQLQAAAAWLAHKFLLAPDLQAAALALPGARPAGAHHLGKGGQPASSSEAALAAQLGANVSGAELASHSSRCGGGWTHAVGMTHAHLTLRCADGPCI